MNGILNVLKPPGMTSHDVVSYVRRSLGIKKVGHTGTLDPGAAGILPICIGKATKIVDFIMNDRKNYICELTLGNKTDTYDKYGKFIYTENKEIPSISEQEFLHVLNNFTGEIKQKPPVYSAIKIKGQRSYDLARQGIEIDIPERTVTIHRISLIDFNPPHIMLNIECSKGTYIRSICNDIGEIIGCHAYMSFLIRCATGRFNLSNCCILEDISLENIDNILFGTDYALDMKEIYIDSNLRNKVLNGNSVKVYNNPSHDGYVKIYIKPHEFIGIGKIDNDTLFIEKLLV